MTRSALKRILIVDDEAALVDTLRERFTPSYEVETATNGTEALTAVVRRRPDVVLLDISLPHMNGVDVLKELQKIDSSIPVIMVTGTPRNAETTEALSLGAVGYLPKPFDFRYLEHLIAASLTGR